MNVLRRVLVIVVFSLAANAAILAGLSLAGPSAAAPSRRERVRVVRARLARPPTEAQPAPPTVRSGAASARADAARAAVRPAPSAPPSRRLLPIRAADLPRLRPLRPAVPAPSLAELELPDAPTGPPADAATAGAGIATPPIPLEPVDPARYYPPDLRRRGVTGRTRVRVRVDRHGRAAAVEIVATTPGFAEAARKLVRAMRFVPATRDGEAVPATKGLKIVWRLEDER